MLFFLQRKAFAAMQIPINSSQSPQTTKDADNSQFWQMYFGRLGVHATCVHNLQPGTKSRLPYVYQQSVETSRSSKILHVISHFVVVICCIFIFLIFFSLLSLNTRFDIFFFSLLGPFFFFHISFFLSVRIAYLHFLISGRCYF